MPDHHSSSSQHLKTLTSLRFFAAFAVLVFHLFSLVPANAPIDFDESASGPLRDALITYLPFLAEGHLAVDFFFVLSGFVLAHVYLDAWKSREFRFGRFVRKRFARIYPLHFATLAAFVVLTLISIKVGAGPRDAAAFDFATLPQHLLMVHAWGTIERLTFNGPSWSISAEWAAYLAFPVVLAVLVRLKPALAVATTIGWFLLINEIASTPEHPLTQRSADFGLLRIAAEFPLGVALLMLSREAFAASARVGTMCFVVGMITTIVSATFAMTPAITVLALSAVIYGAAVSEQHGRLAWLKAPPFVYGGEISYSIYMVHGLVQVISTQMARRAGAPEGTWGFDLAMAAAAVATIVTAHVSYRWVEMPAQRFLSTPRRLRRAIVKQEATGS